MRFGVDPLEGQKTGFFFDQRPNRDRVAALSPGARVLDVFCHTGAFGLRTAAAGAASVTLVDSSAPALERAEAAAAANGLQRVVTTRRGDAFDVMTDLAAAGERFDVVVCDPPAFAKSRKDAEAGLRAYNRMTRLAAPLVDPGRLPVRRILQPPRAVGRVHRAGRGGPAPRPTGCARGVHGRRRPGPPGAPASAGECLSEGAIAAVVVDTQPPASTVAVDASVPHYLWMDDDLPRQAPQEWLDALDRARASGAAGRPTVPLSVVLDDLQACLARMEAREAKASAKA